MTLACYYKWDMLTSEKGTTRTNTSSFKIKIYADDQNALQHRYMSTSKNSQMKI